MIKTENRKSSCQPLGQSGEVGEDVSCHHVKTRLRQLQMNGLQPFVCLSHRVLISGAQAAGGGRGVHPTRGDGEKVDARWRGWRRKKKTRANRRGSIKINKKKTKRKHGNWYRNTRTNTRRDMRARINRHGEKCRMSQQLLDAHVSHNTTCHAKVFAGTHVSVCAFRRENHTRLTSPQSNTDTRWDLVKVSSSAVMSWWEFTSV